MLGFPGIAALYSAGSLNGLHTHAHGFTPLGFTRHARRCYVCGALLVLRRVQDCDRGYGTFLGTEDK